MRLFFLLIVHTDAFENSCCAKNSKSRGNQSGLINLQGRLWDSRTDLETETVVSQSPLAAAQKDSESI